MRALVQPIRKDKMELWRHMAANEGDRSGYDDPWYGWDSPIGLGLLVLAAGLATATVLVAASLLG